MATRYVSPVTGKWAGGPLSKFKARRGRKRLHAGNDLQAPNGSKTVAVVGGRVTSLGNDPGGYDRYAVVHGDDGYAYRYAYHGSHLVKAGDYVAQGAPLGKIARGHLHFEVIPPTSPVFNAAISGQPFSTQVYRGGAPLTIDPAAFFGIRPGTQIAAGSVVGNPNAATLVAETPRHPLLGASPTPPADVSPMGSTLLARGAKGERVAALQHVLARGGYYDGKIDGDFGPATEKAVRAYQEAQNKVRAAAKIPPVKVDGIVGNETRPLLVQSAKQQAGPEAVASADLALGQAAEPAGAPQGDIAGQRRMEDQGVLNAKLGESLSPFAGVSTRPPVTPPPRPPATRPGPFAPMGDAPSVAMAAEIDAANRVMRRPTQAQIETAKQAIRDQQFQHLAGPQDNRAPPGIGAPAGRFVADPRFAQDRRFDSVVGNPNAPVTQAPQRFASARDNFAPPGIGSAPLRAAPRESPELATVDQMREAARRVPMPRGGSFPVSVGASAERMSDVPRKVPTTPMRSSDVPMSVNSFAGPRGNFRAAQDVGTANRLPPMSAPRTVGYAPGTAPPSPAMGARAASELQGYVPTNPMAASASQIPDIRPPPPSFYTPAPQAPPQGILSTVGGILNNPLFRAGVGFVTGGPLGAAVGLGGALIGKAVREGGLGGGLSDNRGNSGQRAGNETGSVSRRVDRNVQSGRKTSLSRAGSDR